MSKKDQIARERPSENAVIITYYVESSSENKKMKPKSFPKNSQTTKKGGYDRRADLLAYANELRGSDPQHVHWSRKSKRSKLNGRKGRWKYKRMGSKENTEVDPLFGVNLINKSGRSSTGDLCRKLKRMLKELSFGCGCYKG